MQLRYSELQAEMLDERARRRKAAKILAVLRHFLGLENLNGQHILDLGCSAGFIADELRLAGGRVVGLDIDEPGLERAKRRFGEHVGFVRAAGNEIPLASKSVDIVIFNHIYEHVPEPLAVMAEMRRVLTDEGVVYLGLGNRLGVMEPHYKLPFLSWLPKRYADRYVRLTGRADGYYETLRTRSGLQRLCDDLHVWDYTYSVLSQPEMFAAHDQVPRGLLSTPPAFWHAISPIIPTYIWVGTPSQREPEGPRLRVNPAPL